MERLKNMKSDREESKSPMRITTQQALCYLNDFPSQDLSLTKKMST
jgi:hypothetical protein